MSFTGEEKKKYNKERHAKKKELDEFLDSLKGKDKLADGERYRSEVLSYFDLGKIYYGQDHKDEDDEDDKKKKKIKRPNPSITEIIGMERSFEEWLQLRDQARKDLFWLGKDVLRKDLEADVHQVVCDQFVQKNFDGAFPAGYTIGDVHDAINRQERFDRNGIATKEMMLLDSRSFYKSTIDGIDAIQWMLNVPDIRILLLTGEYKLGVGFLKEIKGYLSWTEGSDFTDIQVLFPEYVVRGVDGISKEPLTLDVRKHTQVSATLWVNSIDSNLSGWHCDIKKGDDVVTDANSNTEDVRLSLKEKFDGTDNILDDWGFSDNIGTRYFPKDWYGTRLQAYAENPEENAIKYFCRGCWVVKPEYSEITLKELTEDMVVLTFPSKRTFKKLRSKLLNNEREFRCQQLNEPAGEDRGADEFKVSFDEDSLRRHLYQREAAPKMGDIFICWDWALTANKKSDYSAGVVGRIYQKEDGLFALVILEVICDKWTSHELALQIIGLNKKWSPKKTLIENSTGSEWLKNELIRLAPVFGVTLDIYWKPPSLQKHAKRNRVKGLEILLKNDRLWFVMGSWIDQTFSQLERFTGQPKNMGRKDDIPDAMSYFQIAFFPISSMSPIEAEEAKAYQEEEKTRAKLKANYNRIFCHPPNVPDFNSGSVAPTQDVGWSPKWPTR
jgi:phage terminase large subunit-like protein